MTGRSSPRRQQERGLDMDGLLDILGIFSAEPAGGYPFTLEPLSSACLALSGDGITEEESGFLLDVGGVEAEGLTGFTVDVENMGLDAAVVSVRRIESRISARFFSETVCLTTGESARLHVDILGPGVPGLAVEGEVLVLVRRADRVFELPIKVRAVSALMGPAPRFQCGDRSCPAEHDFGCVEARELMETAWERNTPLIFRCTVENVGGQPCALSASIDGEGFELAIIGSNGDVTLQIPSGGSIDVAVKPALAPPGPRRALLRISAGSTRDGAVVAAVRLAADVHSSGPMFTLKPGAERVTAVEGRRVLLPVTIAHLGAESARIMVFPIVGERVLKGEEIGLPASDGVTPTVVEAFVGMETEGLVPGEYTVDLAIGAGAHDRLEPAGSVALCVADVAVEPAQLDFGAIPPGEKAEKEVLMRIPPALSAQAEIPDELMRILSVDAREGGRFIVLVSNDGAAPDEPRQYTGTGFRIAVPAMEFARDVPVSFRRLRPGLTAPDEVDFGSAPPGGAVSVDLRLVNDGDCELKVRASAEEAGIAFAPAGEMVIQAGAERHLSVSLTLPDRGPETNSEGAPYVTAVVLTADFQQLGRRIRLKGRIVPVLRRMCPVCRAVSEPHAQSCWLCEGALDGSLVAAADKIARCSRCNSLFSSDYTFCPKDGGELLPFSESS